MTSASTGTRAGLQLGLPGVEAPNLVLPRLITARYAVVDPSEVVPVQTSIGRPGWVSYELVAWPAVMPYGLLGETDLETFRRKYRHALHKRTPRILRELAEMRESYDGWPLALCCFEDVRRAENWCHRLFLAEWLAEHLGEEIPDVEGR